MEAYDICVIDRVINVSIFRYTLAWLWYSICYFFHKQIHFFVLTNYLAWSQLKLKANHAISCMPCFLRAGFTVTLFVLVVTSGGNQRYTYSCEAGLWGCDGCRGNKRHWECVVKCRTRLTLQPLPPHQPVLRGNSISAIVANSNDQNKESDCESSPKS